jgi:1,2-diacylglycerol 3-alpha-glucosyltransferase
LSDAPVRVFIPCSGLGRVARGFETFTREVSDALRGDPRLEVRVFAGGATADRDDTVLPSLARSSRAAMTIGALVRRSPYFVEQGSFFTALLPHLILGRPDLVYFADLNIGNACWHWRRLSGQRYRLLFYNGGATTRPFTRADMVQQLVSVYRDDAIARGESPERNVVLPHGVAIPPALFAPARGPLRESLGLPVDRQVVLAVGTLDQRTKNIPYLLRELASLPAPRPLLVLLGAATPETPAILTLATELLGADGFQWHSVAHTEMPRWYAAADAFVMASLREGFGLAYVEALAHGLPVLAHDYAVARELLGDDGCYGDFQQSGVLTALLQRVLDRGTDDFTRHARHRHAFDRFSWERLRERYAELLIAAAAMPRR